MEGLRRGERGVTPWLWKLQAERLAGGCTKAAEDRPAERAVRLPAPWWVGEEMAVRGLNLERSAIWRAWEATWA